ncbi:MAG TPA: IS3 family transposase [Methylomirabilota bacterium]|nr:IS3 family transposase [Methylomirabilota bacterium]
MTGHRKRYSADLKAKVALEAIRGQKTTNEIASEYGVHPTQITQWKKQALEELPQIFSSRREKAEQAEEELKSTLYQEIGQLKVELDWLKKKQERSVKLKRALIEPEHLHVSIARQCELLQMARSSYYYEPAQESEENLQLMRLLDEQYTRLPFYGTRKMTAWLHTQGYEVNRKRVTRLLRLMGLEAIYPKPHLSVPGSSDQRYPYLLRGMSIERCNQVWSCDITYIRLQRGFVYLMAIIDWFSRYVLAWEVSNTLDTSFCLDALDRALQVATPDIFNSDQGVQFTSAEFTNRLKAADIRISWDGRGRALDNIFVERLWRSVKYEDVYIKDYQSVLDAVSNLRAYFTFYNQERLHQSLAYQTPAQVYLKQ